MANRHPFDEGAAYRNGKLYEFTRDCVIIMKGWPEMRAWQWTGIHARPWRHVRPRLKHISLREMGHMEDPDLHPPEPNGQMLFPFAYSYTGIQAHRAFWWKVPKPYRHLVMPFRDRRWHMLVLLARCPGAEDLAVGNPALAFCLASNWLFHKPAPSHPLRAARAMVYKKQRWILEWLGFPATESVRQILRRVPPESMTAQFLMTLGMALCEPRWTRRFSFIERINEDVFRTLTDFEGGPQIDFALVEEISHHRPSDAHPAIAYRIQDIRRMCDGLGRKVPRLRSIAQINEMHDDLAFAMNLKRADQGGPLPPPPIPGISGEIEPLESSQAILQEGRQQQHCVGGYVACVQDGEAYIYRMLKPERATLAISRGPRGWSLREIHGLRNADVRPDSYQAALDWLNGWRPQKWSDPALALAGDFAGPDDLPF